MNGQASSLTGKSPPLGGPQARPGFCREQKNLLLQIDQQETLMDSKVVLKSLSTFEQAYRPIKLQQFE